MYGLILTNKGPKVRHTNTLVCPRKILSHSFPMCNSHFFKFHKKSQKRTVIKCKSPPDAPALSPGFLTSGTGSFYNSSLKSFHINLSSLCCFMIDRRQLHPQRPSAPSGKTPYTLPGQTSQTTHRTVPYNIGPASACPSY